MVKYWMICGFVLLISVRTWAQQSLNTRILKIDTAYAVRVTASQVLEEVNYIPLETTGESLFGEITQLGVTKEYFIIYDSRTNCILLFSKNGKFHAKIKLDAYTNGRFSVNREKQEIIFSKGSVLYYYDFNGNKLRQEYQKNIGHPHFFSKKIVVYADYRVSDKYLPDSISHELFLMQDNHVNAGFLPYNMKKGPWKMVIILALIIHLFMRLEVIPLFIIAALIIIVFMN